MNTAEFDKIEKFVLTQIAQIFYDIFDSIQILQKKQRLIKSQLCLVFVAADSFSRFYRILSDENYDIENEKYNNEQRFREWLDKFVLNNSNEIYKSNQKKICDSKIIWDFRNSLLHFYGFPRKRSICMGNLPIPKDEWKKFNKYYQEKIGRDIQTVEPYILTQAILHGFVVQKDILVDMIKNHSQDYIKGILKLNKIFKEEGTIFVDYTNKIV